MFTAPPTSLDVSGLESFFSFGVLVYTYIRGLLGDDALNTVYLLTYCTVTHKHNRSML